jgi:hypothetical protein
VAIKWEDISQEVLRKNYLGKKEAGYEGGY